MGKVLIYSFISKSWKHEKIIEWEIEKEREKKKENHNNIIG